MDHAEIKDLIPLKALSRLEGEEASAVDEHLAAGCDECARELGSFNEALAAMAMAESGGAAPSERRRALVRRKVDGSPRCTTSTSSPSRCPRRRASTVATDDRRTT